MNQGDLPMPPTDGAREDVDVQIDEQATRRLVRRVDRRWVAGVAGGLADATGTDPTWWRVAFALLTAVGGLGALIYLLLWWIIPRADLPRSAGQRFAAHFPDAPSWIGVGLLMVGALFLVGQLGLWTPTVAAAFILIGLGVVLYRRESDRSGRDRPGAQSGTQAQADPSVGSTAGAWNMPTRELWSPASRESVLRPPRRPRERALLGWLSFGVALMAGGVLWALTDGGSATPSLAQVLGIPLAVLGAGLLVGSVVGRSKWTILPALLLVPPVLVASLIRVPLDAGWTDRTIRPVSAADIRTTYQQSGATLAFDLSHLAPGEHPAPIHAEMGIGAVQIFVPKGMPITVHTTVGVGSLGRLGGEELGGVGLEGTARVEGADPVLIDVEIGIGTFTIYSTDPASRDRQRAARAKDRSHA
jgi:phage shock protein PspC (stress-responsive transcriptional regulator)